MISGPSPSVGRGEISLDPRVGLPYPPSSRAQTLPISPGRRVCVVTCPDPRTDPEHFLELQLGDAAVIRHAGGRVNQAVIDDLAFIGYLSETVLQPEGPRFEVVVIHHNKCGTSFLADAGFRRNFATHVGGDEAALAASPGLTLTA